MSPVLAHLSDLHLGHGIPDREGGAGAVLEADARDAFLRAVRALIRIRPDLVLITGDLFDSVEPPSAAVAALVRGVRSLGRALPRTPVLVLAGPRDTPVTPGDPGPLAILESLPRVEVATGTARSVHLREAGMHVLLVPHAALLDPPFPVLAPDPEARWNILALRATEGGGESSPAVDPGRWDWVALGGDHQGREVAPRVVLAGSPERVTTDPWAESGDGRGFVTVDLAAGVVTRHVLPGRPVVEVAPLARGRQELPRVNARLRMAVEAVPGGVDGRRVRMRIHGIDPAERAELDGAFLAVLRRRAAELQLQLRASEDGAELRGVPQVMAGRGVRALVGGSDRLREETLTAWRRDAPDGLPELPGPEDRAETPDELLLWRGRGPDGPGALLDAAAALLDRLGGGGPGTGRGPASGEGGEAGPAPGPRGGDARGPAVGAGAPSGRALSPGGETAGELELAEAAVLSLRADSVEVDGEVEALTVEWLRERQDAETQLQTHRDRARELKARIRSLEAAGPEAPCPVCGRPLSDHFEQVERDFREEWDALVQDGRWWRRRREQLEPKPEALRTLEAEGIRLHAELEAATERLEGVRTGAARRGAGAAEAEPPAPGTGSAGAPGSPDPGSPSGSRGALLARGSDLLNRLTGGRLAGMIEGEGGLRLVADGTVLPLVTEGERAAVATALHLAMVELALEAGVAPAVLRVGGPLTRLDSGDAVRSVLLLEKLARHLPGVVMNPAPGTVPRVPERLGGIVEVREGDAGSGLPRLVLRPGGEARVRLAPGRGR